MRAAVCRMGLYAFGVVVVVVLLIAACSAPARGSVSDSSVWQCWLTGLAAAGCLSENGANYNGTLVESPLNLQITQTAAECCNLCAQVNSETLPFPCNSWVWCGPEFDLTASVSLVSVQCAHKLKQH